MCLYYYWILDINIGYIRACKHKLQTGISEEKQMLE